MSENITALLYLVSGVLFILALRGLSHPESSRRGNQYGMAGMAIAVLTTLFGHPPVGSGWLLLIVGIGIGGTVGATIAKRIPMTAMPQLVAAFHSLVGLAAVLVAAAALYAPEAFDIGTKGEIAGISLVEMSLGLAIGAITFTGSIIAFLKLDGRMSGAPILLPARHGINLGLAVLLLFLIIAFVQNASPGVFWLITIVSLIIGVLITIICFTILEPLLRLFRASGPILPLAKRYVSILIAFQLLNPLLMVLGNIIRAEGRPILSSAGMIVSANVTR